MLENDECGFDNIQREAAMRTLDYYMSGNTHFTELSARGCIAQMYYYVDDTHKAFAPFVDYDEMKAMYGDVKDDIMDYNMWDFAVTVNLVYSNHHDTLKAWSKNHERMMKKVSQLAVGFLNDEDSAHHSDKIFWYMNT